MTRQEFIGKLKAEFKRGLQQKTGWGRQEVWVLFIECLVDALAEDEQSRKEAEYGDEVHSTAAVQVVDGET